MYERRMLPRREPESGAVDPLSVLKSEDLYPHIVKFQQCVACAAATLTMFVVGSIHGWTTTTLLHLTSGSDDVPITLTHVEYSWIVSLTVLCSMVGSLVGAQLADRSGRKRCLLICSTMFIFGWWIIHVTTSVRMLYFARVIHGIGIGIAHTINPMYVSEAADIKIRGALGSLITLNLFAGSLVTCSLASKQTYKAFLLILAIMSFASFYCNTCYPETPYFLVAKGRKEKAHKSITFFKGIGNLKKMQNELRDLRAQTRYELNPQSRYELRQQSRSHFPSQSRTDLPSQSRSDLPSQSKTDLPLKSRTDLRSESRTDLPSQSRRNFILPFTCYFASQSESDIASQSRSDLPSQSKTDLPLKSRTDLPSESRTDLPSQSRRNFILPFTCYFASQSESDIASQSRSDLPSQSKSNLPPESEEHSGGIWKDIGDTEPTSDLPSSSDSPSISVIHSEVICDVHRQPTGELRRQITRHSLEFPLQPLRASQSQSKSKSQQPSTSEIQPASTSEIQPASTSDIQPASTSEIQPASTSEIQPASTSEIQPASTSEIQPASISEIEPASTSEIQPASTSEIQPASTSEIQPASTSEIQPASTSEIQPASTSEIEPASTSEIQPASTSQIQPASTSEIQPAPTSQIQPESTSEIEPASTNEIQPASTSEIQPASTSEIQPTSISEIQPASTSKIEPASTSEIEPASTSEIEPASTSEIQPASTSETNSDLVCEMESESGSNLRTQSESDLNRQSTTDSHEMTVDTDDIHMDGTKRTCLTKLQVILHRSNRKALFIMLGLIMAQRLSGNIITMQYLKLLLQKTTLMNPNGAMITIQAVNFISGILSTFTVDRVGRRKFLILSTLGSCFTLSILATYLLLIQYKFDDSIVSILAVIDLIIYQIMYQIGLGIIPTVLLCEIFPMELKGFVAAITVIFDGILDFAVSNVYQVIIDNTASYLIYYIFATSCAFAFLMVFIFIPETKKKTYEEIEALLFVKNLNSPNVEVG